jgi:transcriptional regulator with XRE-family HTH domain/tetratricopeptide (TPR) repeat protein
MKGTENSREKNTLVIFCSRNHIESARISFWIGREHMHISLLRIERERRGWSQERLAKLLGVSARTVIRWEQGSTIPYPHYRDQLANLFQMSEYQLGLPSPPGEEKSEIPPATSPVTSVMHDTIPPVASIESPSFLADPLIPEILGHPDRLLGRHDLLTRIKSDLFDGSILAITALKGLPGIGKTTLAAALAIDSEVRSHFSDGILWVGLGPQPNALTQLSRWGTLLGVRPEDVTDPQRPSAWSQALHSIISSRRFLIVIDDAWTPEDAAIFKIGGSSCAHLLTTRLPHVAFVFAQNRTMIVPELSESDALTLLARYVPQLVEQELESARALVQAVGGLPLALKLMGTMLASQTFTRQPRRLQAALRQLEDAQNRLRMSMPTTLLERSTNVPEDVPLSLQATIAVSDGHLSGSAHRALCALALFPPKPNTFSEEMALEVSGEAIESLDELWDVGLLESSGPGRYSLHQTIADYARLQGENLPAKRRLVQAVQRFLPSQQQQYDVLENEVINMQTALDFSVELGLRQDLTAIALASAPYMRVRGHYALASRYLLQALQFTEKDFRREQLALLQPLATFAELQGDYIQAEAYCQQGLALAREFDQQQARCGLLATQASIAHRQGDYARSQIALEEGLPLARELGDTERICSCLCYLGRIAHYRVDLPEAEAFFREGLTLARQHGLREIECLLLTYLAAVLRERTIYDQALQSVQEGLELARSLKHREHISRLLEIGGNIEHSIGDLAKAEAYYLEGLELARRIQHRDETCRLLATLGTLLTFPFQNRHAEAEVHLREGIDLARQANNLNIMPHLLLGLGGAVGFQGDYVQAESCYQEAYDLTRKQELIWETAAVLTTWGLFRLSHRIEDAGYQQLTAALQLNVTEPQMVALAQYGLAHIAAAMGNIAEARHLGQASLKVFEATHQVGRAEEIRRLLLTLPADPASEPEAAPPEAVSAENALSEDASPANPLLDSKTVS